MAGTITSISPTMVKVNSGEHFLTIYGSGLGTVVAFNGPAGYYERSTNANFSGSVVVWVPERVVQTSGFYNVWVKGGTGDSNAVTFEVRGFKFFPFVIIAPEVLRAQALNREGGYVKYNVFWAGGESNDGTVNCLPKSGDWFKWGSTTVDCTGSNTAGESAKASFTVLVMDEIPPTVYVPREPIVTKWTHREGAVVNYDAKAYDDIYGDLPADCNPRSGSMFPVGVTTVQCSATDTDGNMGWGHFNVEVLGDVKFYKLNVVGPANVVTDARSAEGATVGYKVDVTNGEGVEVTCYPKSGSVFPIGVTMTTCDAIDMWGMRGQYVFPVVVRDPKAPFIDKLYATPDILRADGLMYNVDITAIAFDDLDPRPVCKVFGITSNQAISTVDSEKGGDWEITGDTTVRLRGTFTRTDRYYDVWVGCEDFYGNRSNGTARVVVPSGSGLSTPSTPTKRRSGPKG